MIEYVTEGLLNLIFPLNCRICKKPIRESKGYSICEDCFQTIELIAKPYCVKCNKPLSLSPDWEGLEVELWCVDCKNKHFSFEFSRSVGKYSGVLKEAIHLFKYQGEKKLAKPLGNLLINYLKENPKFRELIDLIIPVPLHKDNLKERGFNQSVLLGEIIGNYFSIPVKEGVLIKKRLTPSQVNLSKKEREKNMREAFLVQRPQEVKEKNILILDDIFTTGSTVEGCARELKKAKAKNVYILTLARSI